jgi:hypothetical protein
VFLVRSLFWTLAWLLTLPFRLALFLLGVVLWIVTLPLRIIFGVLVLIGLGRILQLIVFGSAAYAVYRLVSGPPDEATPPATS